MLKIYFTHLNHKRFRSVSFGLCVNKNFGLIFGEFVKSKKKKSKSNKLKSNKLYMLNEIIIHIPILDDF